MSDAHSPVEFTAEELAYANSRGEVPLPQEGDADAPREAAETPAAAETPPEQDDPEIITEGEEDSDQHKGRKVRYNAYLRQKNEADAARKEREEYRQKFEASERERAIQNARIEERFRAWQAAQQAQQAPQGRQQPAQPDLPPDRNADPLAYMEWQDRQRAALEQRLGGLEQGYQQSAQQAHQSRQIAQLDTAYRQDNLQAAREVPEYRQAYDFMIERAARILQIQAGRALPPHEINAAVEMQERQLAAAAFQSGRRPAQMIMQMATEYGWRPQAQQQEQAPQIDATAEQAKVDAVARGQDRNRTLSSAGRPGGSASTMTLEKFTSMSDDEADAWIKANPAAHARLGGMQ